jgi:hypothetical protein
MYASAIYYVQRARCPDPNYPNSLIPVAFGERWERQHLSKRNEADLAAVPRNTLRIRIEEGTMKRLCQIKSVNRILFYSRQTISVLTSSSTCKINITKHHEVVWLLPFDTIPFMLLVLIQQLVFTNSVDME